MPEKAQRNIFLSYATRDKRSVKAVIDQLKKRGIVAEDDEFVDPSKIVVPGASIRGELREAIRAASKVVVLWSGAGAESELVNYEAGMARALDKPMVLVVPKGGATGVPSELADLPVFELLPKGP